MGRRRERTENRVVQGLLARQPPTRREFGHPDRDMLGPPVGMAVAGASRKFVVALAACVAVVVPATTRAGSGLRKSATIGALDETTCRTKLKKLKIPHVRAPSAPRIEQPIILTGPIEGVHFDTGRPYAQRSVAAGDAIDCRLAIALVDLAKVVKKRGIGTVLVKSFHRPTQQIVDPGAPLRHRVGFAIDVAGFRTKKGQIWSVEHDFHGKIGQATCGPAAAKPVPDTHTARALWSIFCDVAATEAFDSGISPNYNASHFDHMHFDLTTDHPIVFYP
jgi:hypothetical protein